MSKRPPHTILNCGSRRALAKFDWDNKPPCVKPIDWDILQCFHLGDPMSDIAKEIGVSKQAIAIKIRGAIERTHASVHPDHKLMCQLCMKL